MSQLSSELTWLMLDASVKSLILGVPLLVSLFIFRRVSVHVAHRLWTVFLAAMLAIPVLSVMSPTWSLPVSWFTLATEQQGKEVEIDLAERSARTATPPSPRQHRDAVSEDLPASLMPPGMANVDATSIAMPDAGIADPSEADGAGERD